MKQLEFNQMEHLQGGIACDEVPGVMAYLRKYHYSQYLAILDTFLYGGYTLQCDSY